MSEPYRYDVFISHSAKDKPAVRELAGRLRASGLRVWPDEWEIQPGDMIGLWSSATSSCCDPNASTPTPPP